MCIEIEKCLWCDEPGEFLCDLIIGRALGEGSDPGTPRPGPREVKKRKAWGTKRYPWPEGRAPGTLIRTAHDTFLTCDSPMCRRHAQQVGSFCKIDDSGQVKGECDGIDMCQFHWGFDGSDIHRVLSESDADAYRRRLRMAVSNGHHGAESDDFYGYEP